MDGRGRSYHIQHITSRSGHDWTPSPQSAFRPQSAIHRLPRPTNPSPSHPRTISSVACLKPSECTGDLLPAGAPTVASDELVPVRAVKFLQNFNSQHRRRKWQVASRQVQDIIDSYLSIVFVPAISYFSSSFIDWTCP